MISSDSPTIRVEREARQQFNLSVNDAASLLVYHLIHAADMSEIAGDNHHLLSRIIKRAIPDNPEIRIAALAFVEALSKARGSEDDDIF